MGGQCLLSVPLWVGLLAPDLALVMEDVRFRDQGSRLVWPDDLLCFSCNDILSIIRRNCQFYIHRHSYLRFFSFSCSVVLCCIPHTYPIYITKIRYRLMYTYPTSVAINCVRHQQTRDHCALRLNRFCNPPQWRQPCVDSSRFMFYYCS